MSLLLLFGGGTPVTSYTLSISPAAFVLTNNAIAFAYGRVMPVTKADFTLTYNAMAFAYGRTLTVVTASYVVTTNDLSFTYIRPIWEPSVPVTTIWTTATD